MDDTTRQLQVGPEDRVAIDHELGLMVTEGLEIDWSYFGTGDPDDIVVEVEARTAEELVQILGRLHRMLGIKVEDTTRTVKARDVKVGDCILFTWDADPGDPEVGPDPSMQEAVLKVDEVTVDKHGVVRLYADEGMIQRNEDEENPVEVYEDADLDALGEDGIPDL